MFTRPLRHRTSGGAGVVAVAQPLAFHVGTTCNNNVQHERLKLITPTRYRGSVSDAANGTITNGGKVQILVSLPATVFDREKKRVYPGWRKAVADLAAVVK